MLPVREYGFLYLFCVYEKKFEKETAGFMNYGGGCAVLAKLGMVNLGRNQFKQLRKYFNDIRVERLESEIQL
jgi:hypothetical protein